MKNLWNDQNAKEYISDLLAMRVYSSRLLGQDPNLVLHGGGNTSVKATVTDIFGHAHEVLYVKGSGWDLASIEKEGFAPVKMTVLQSLARLDQLRDTEMVTEQRKALLDPKAPSPSVEAILHAIIPMTFVDHTHADAVVTVTNTPHGHDMIRDIYGDRALIIPYVMPGFVLAKKVYEMTQQIAWEDYDAMILLHHGVFTFADSAKESYGRMIDCVSKAEEYLEHRNAVPRIRTGTTPELSSVTLAQIRHDVSKLAQKPMLAMWHRDDASLQFSCRDDVADIATRGPLTPDHMIRTKRCAAILSDQGMDELSRFARDYRAYFGQYHNGTQTCLDPAPRWAVWKNRGQLSFGSTVKDCRIIGDIIAHTITAIMTAETLGGWTALSREDLFDMEYWELEQAKLKNDDKSPLFEGRIALVTGAYQGIGRACVESLYQQGAAVCALDIHANIEHCYDQAGIKGIICDVTQNDAVAKAIERCVAHFGGLDILISNAGVFPQSMRLADMDGDVWEQSLAVNLTGSMNILKHAAPLLELGWDPSVLIIGSKNVSAPGPGAGAYSAAKAGLTQLSRVAALELADKGIRVNMLHPNAVFDTGLWSEAKIQERARQYGVTVQEYKTNNLLKKEITSHDVAALACAVVGPLFAKTTGAQIPIDGGLERVI